MNSSRVARKNPVSYDTETYEYLSFFGTAEYRKGFRQNFIGAIEHSFMYRKNKSVLLETEMGDALKLLAWVKSGHDKK